MDVNLNSELARNQLNALASHESGHGLRFVEHSTFTNHVMHGGNAGFNPPIQITNFEALMNAIQIKLNNLTDMNFYSK